MSGPALAQLAHRCELVRAALAGDPLDAAMDDAAGDGFEGLARLLRTLEELKATAATAASLVAGIMADTAGRDIVTVEELGTFEVKPGTTRKTWNHAAAVRDVYAWALDPAHRADPETGELVPEGEAVRDAILAAGAFAYWRVGALKAMGLRADLYSEVERGGRRLVPRWNEPLEGDRPADPVERRTAGEAA